jgi:hypothetical protein
MKKVQMLFVAMIVASVALFSFKSSTTATRYGGTASVKINIVKVIERNSERTTVSSPTLNATESCSDSDAAGAKSSLKVDLERQADSKKNAMSFSPGVKYEWEYANEISYRITTCD